MFLVQFFNYFLFIFGVSYRETLFDFVKKYIYIKWWRRTRTSTRTRTRSDDSKCCLKNVDVKNYKKCEKLSSSLNNFFLLVATDQREPLFSTSIVVIKKKFKQHTIASRPLFIFFYLLTSHYRKVNNYDNNWENKWKPESYYCYV